MPVMPPSVRAEQCQQKNCAVIAYIAEQNERLAHLLCRAETDQSLQAQCLLVIVRARVLEQQALRRLGNTDTH